MAPSCLRCASNPPAGGDHCPDCGDSHAVRLQLVGSSPLKAQLLERLRAATSGEFEVIREIGNGGMAKVYLARELALERPVAIKVLSPLFSEYPEIVRRFHQEARTAAQLSHPHVVPVFAVYQGTGLCFFTMPFVEGPSLRQVLHACGMLELNHAMDYLRQAAAALSYAHEHGVVHRDVKPENMLLEQSTGRLMLTDFGLAKALGGESLTVPGDMIGTPQYMAPEQCEGSRSVDGRSDQYSLALVAYELLTGEYPFEGEGLRELLMKRLSEDPPSLRAKRPDVPEHISTAIQRALARNADDRYASIDAFIRVLSGSVIDDGGAERYGRLGLLGRSLASGLPKAAGVRLSPTPQPALRVPAEMGRVKAWAVRGTVVAAAAAMCYLAIATMSGSDVSPLAFFDGPAYPEGETGTEAVEFEVLGPPAPRGQEVPADAANVIGAGSESEADGTDAGASRAAGPPAATDARVSARLTAADPITGDRDVASRAAPVGGASRRADAAGSVAPPQALLERYRRALEDEDMAEVEALHDGGMGSADARFLEKMFETAEQIEADVQLLSLEVDDERATVEVDFPLRYVLSKTKWSQRHTLKLRLGLVKGPDGWRIERSGRR